MKQKVLVDTSIWVEFFRGRNQKVKAYVSSLIKSQQACLAGVVIAELFHGVRKKNELKLLKETLPALSYFEVTRDVWEKTGEILRKLRLRGVTLPLTDVLLAAIAAENKCEILTYDNHFQKLEEVSLHQIPKSF